MISQKYKKIISQHNDINLKQKKVVKFFIRVRIEV